VAVAAVVPSIGLEVCEVQCMRRIGTGMLIIRTRLRWVPQVAGEWNQPGVAARAQRVARICGRYFILNKMRRRGIVLLRFYVVGALFRYRVIKSQ